MSGQFPDQILDPALRKLGWRFGVGPDREAVRGRLEQEVGFADYGKYSREQIIEGLRLLEKEGFHIKMPDGARLSPADLAEHVRRSFPEPGPQSGLLQAPRSSLAAAYAAPTLPTDAAPEPLLRPLSPALSARVHALLSSQGEPTSPSDRRRRELGAQEEL